MKNNRFTLTVFLLILSTTLFMFITAFNCFKTSVHDTLFNSNVAKVNAMVHIHHMQKLHYDTVFSLPIAAKSMQLFTESLDKEPGVFAAMYDSSFNLISERFCYDITHFEDSLSADHIRMLKRESQGFYTFEDIRYYYCAYPLLNPRYYILVAVSPYIFDDMFDPWSFTVLFIIVGIITFCTLSYAILKRFNS